MADLPADATTPAVIAPGGVLLDAIERRGDRDWVRIDLDAGQVVAISVEGWGEDPLGDSYLRIRGPGGKVIEANDDYGPGTGSTVTFLAPRTGRYFIEVAGYDRSATGAWRLTVEETAMPADIRPLLDWGTAQPDARVTYWFAPGGRKVAGHTSEGFNDHEKARIAAAFDLIGAVTGLTFREVSSARGADFRLALDLDEVQGEFLGFLNPPGEAGAGAGVFDGAQWDRAPGGSLEAGGHDFVTIVHEILHGLGLAHPHDNGGGSAVFPGVSGPFGDYGYFGLNQGVWTTMSYNTGHPGDDDSRGHIRGKWGYEYGPMALDIAVLQQKYGANMDHATGDDTYLLPARNGAGTFWQAIWDAGGTDTIRHDGRAGAVIDLRAATLAYEAGGGGFLSAAAGIAGGFTIAAGVVIENATGGAGHDRITGNAAANRLEGRGGNDILEGGAGDDILAGGAGRDRLTGGAGGDTLTGGRGADLFLFRAAGDSPAGNGDVIADFGPGRDRIHLGAFGGLEFIGTDGFGGTGRGELSWRSEGAGIVVAADADGDGTADLVFRLAGVDSLARGDFIL